MAIIGNFKELFNSSRVRSTRVLFQEGPRLGGQAKSPSSKESRRILLGLFSDVLSKPFKKILFVVGLFRGLGL